MCGDEKKPRTSRREIGGVLSQCRGSLSPRIRKTGSASAAAAVVVNG
jgi:hypothetical protein